MGYLRSAPLPLPMAACQWRSAAQEQKPPLPLPSAAQSSREPAAALQAHFNRATDCQYHCDPSLSGMRDPGAGLYTRNVC